MKWKSLFAAACAAALAALPALAQDSTGGGIAPTIPGRAISVNFTNEANKIPEGTVYGIDQAQVAGWNNVTPVQLDGGGYAATVDKGTVEVTGSDGASAAKLAFVANNVWSYSQASVSTDGVDSLLCYYLGDNTHTNAPNGQVITVSEIPFETYDVIVYLSTDTASTSFLPVIVNDTKYVGTAAGAEEVSSDTATWGTSQPTTSSLGGNVLCVEGVTGASLTIQGSVQKEVDGALRRCNIAGFQIVERLPLTINVNIEGRNNNGAAPDSIFSDGDAFSGLVPVQNKNWSEIDTPNGESRTVSVEQAIDSTGEATTAAITVNVGGGWHLRDIAGADARKERLGLMGIGYADAYTSANTPEVVLADIPYTEYSVILYYATDNQNMKWAPAKVTAGDTVTYYYYGEDETLKSDGTSTSTWGSSNDCMAAATTGTLGKDTMRIDNLSGDVSIDLDTSSNADNTRGGLSGLQIVCTGEVIVPPPPTINVNFASGRVGEDTSHDRALTGDTTYGLEPVPGSEWKNLYKGDRNNDVALAVCNGETSVVPTVTYNASGMWSYEEDIEGINDLLFAALDDASALSGTSNNTTITVSDVPFTQYDVIVYLQATGQGGGFKPVEVNGSYYSWQGGATQAVTDSSDTYAWGTLSQPQPALGVNALRISGQTARELTINAPVRTGGVNNSKRCNVTGFQIVCTGEVIEDFLDPTKEGVISLNFGSDRRAVPENATTYGLVPVAGKKWQNFSGASDTDVAITRAENTDLADAPTVTYTSAITWYTGTNDAHPFLQGYLDDGPTSDGYGATISVANLPYSAYDVIVYAGYSDSGEDNIHPYEIDGTLYRWDDAKQTTVATTDTSAAASWGSLSATPVYGENALRVRGRLASTLSPLTVKGLPRLNQDAERGGIAALQIVERKLITENFANALAALAEDTPVYIRPTAQIAGDLTLPADAVLDLRYVAWDNPVVSGTLTLGANTMIRLPGGRVKYAIAEALAGATDSVQVFVHDDIMDSVGQLADGVTISGGTITRPVTYEWTGAGTDTNWTTAANWSSGVVPDENAAVTVTLAANDAKTITLNTAATARLFYISGPSSGSATLEIVAAENVEGAKLTVVDKMFTTGNVTVTQNANIDVAGTSQMGDGSPIPANQVVQAGFQVNGSGATYTVESGALVVQVPDSTVGDVSVSNGATLEVRASGTLTAARVVVSYYGNSTEPVIRTGTLRIAGQATFSTQVAFRNEGLTMELAGGTMTTPSVSTFDGLAVSADSTLAAPEVGTLTVSGSTKALTGAGSLTLRGTVVFSSTITATYTGELTAAAGSTVTLGENRPKLSVAESATVKITPSASEQVSGEVSFVTSMKTLPSATFTVEGVDAVTPAVDNGTLTLSWEASVATLAATGNWSAANWTVGETSGQAAPTSGVVVLDGTAEGGITVTLDKTIPAAITTINVRGDVTLVATEQQATLPTCINVEDGATLGVGANFAKADGSAWPDTWDIPANTTLRVTGDSFDFGGITVDHNQYIQVYADLVVTATGAEGTPALIEPENNLWCRGKVTVSGDYVTLRKLYWLDDVTDGLTVTGDNVTIEGLRQVDGTEGLTLSGNNVRIIGDVNGFAFENNDATITSSGTGNVLDGVTDWPNTFTVTSGDLTIDSCTSLKGALLSNGATLKLASDWAAGQELHVSTKAGDSSVMGLDMSAVAAVNRPTLARYNSSSNALPKNLQIASSAEEDEAGEIRITLMAASKPVLPAGGLAVTVTPATEGVVWNAVATIEENTLVITNVVLKPVLPEGSTLSEAATAALNAAAEQAGITGEYAVAITTGDATVPVTTAEAATQLQEVLECFTDLTLKASTESGNTVTVVYDFGIVGIKRNTTGDGWVVTAKVQGEGAAQAGFAEGNAYTLTVNGTEVSVAPWRMRPSTRAAR